MTECNDNECKCKQTRRNLPASSVMGVFICLLL